MPQFSYKALDSTGQSVTGSVAAASRAAAMDQVSQRGLVPVAIDEQAAAAAAVKHPGPVRGKVSQAAAESFIRELSSLLAGAVPLSRALHILSREASQPAAKAQWTTIHDSVVGGQTLAEAMAGLPKTFTPVQVAMVRAGETGGFLDVVLGQIADFRAREHDLKSRVKGAMIYPAVLATLSCVVMTVLLTFFIPRFSGIFSEFGAALPSLTLAIIAVSHVVSDYGLWFALAVIAGIVAAKRALSTPAGRRKMERILLRAPAVGSIVARFAQVRFCRMLGTLLGAGVPLVNALKVAREAIGNQTLSDAVNSSIEEVQRGATLARSLAACPILFPPSVSEVIAVAEESGRLDAELIRLAAANETELDRRLRTLVTLAEPAMLFIMAALVGLVVIGMLLPVFTLQDYIH